MRAALVALLLLQSARQTDAARLEKTEWMQNSARFCMSETATLRCDDDSIISFGTAFYGRARRVRGRADACEQLPAREALPGEAGTCNANFTERVSKKCDRRRECKLEPGFHPPACADFFTMRTVWNCTAGIPIEDAEDQEPPNLEEDDDDELMPAIEPDPQEKAEEFIEEISDAPEHNVTFHPCWRKAKSETEGLLGALPEIDCPYHEDCFKLSWPGDLVFRNKENPPLAVDLVGASLVKSSSRPVFRFDDWNTLDLEWNDPTTWGICLPKKRGLEFAATVFEGIQEHQKRRLAEELRTTGHKAVFSPCWRRDVQQMVGLLSILPTTTCKPSEDCFVLAWPDPSIVFDDAEHPPAAADIKNARLRSNHMMSLGLELNLPKTWGVCLPTWFGTSFAVSAFTAMKMGHES